MSKEINGLLFNFLNLLSVIAVFFIVLFSLVYLRPAFATTPQETCEIKGGVWTGEYCAPRDMTDDEIVYAQEYTKHAEMKGLLYVD